MTMLQRRTLALAVFSVIGVGLLGVGAHWVVLREISPHVKAKVGACDVSGTARRRRVDCDGSWTTGDLLNGGHVDVGKIIGADVDDEGKTVDVFVHGGNAYVMDWGMPIMFFALGAACFVAGGYVWRQGGAAKRRNAAVNG